MRTSQSIIRMALLAAGVTVAVTALAEEPCVFKDGKDVVEKRPVTEVDGAMVPHGLVECFYAGGAKRSKTEWQKGVRNGTDKGWFKDGQQEFDGAWVDGWMLYGWMDRWYVDGWIDGIWMDR
jgi:antitoxin component YwqK of YwqJK toxin-antitoxin module